MEMELEQSMQRETTPSAQAMPSKNTWTSTILANDVSPSVTTTGISSSSSSLISSSAKDLLRCSKSFRTLDIGAPKSNNTTDKKLAWLRSQIIGDDVEFDSPFGKRRLTYADHTASGRSLRYIENFIINNVLPFYGNFFLLLSLFFFFFLLYIDLIVLRLSIFKSARVGFTLETFHNPI
jgi:hypothetical protein